MTKMLFLQISLSSIGEVVMKIDEALLKHFSSLSAPKIYNYSIDTKIIQGNHSFTACSIIILLHNTTNDKLMISLFSSYFIPMQRTMWR